MKIKRCALVAAVVLAVCTVAFWCGNQSVSEVGNVAENSVTPIRAATSAAPTSVAALAAPVAGPASNQTATVRGTKPYVLTCGKGFGKSLRLAVESTGARTVGQLTRKSLLVEADAAALARLRTDGRFAVERELLPSDKIAPDLAAILAAGADSVEVALLTLSPADHRLVEGRVVARGGEILKGCFNEGDSFRARLPAALVAELASCGDVRWMEVFTRPRLMNDVAVSNAAMNVCAVWKSEVENPNGLSGEGQFISTSDSGIDMTHEDLADQICGSDVVNGCEESDVNGHGTHTAGSIVGNGTKSEGRIRGTAWGAKLWAWFCGAKGGGGGILTPARKADLFRPDQEQFPTYIHSASWGSAKNGQYDVECREIDVYVWEHPDFLPVFAAGNEGVDRATWKTVPRTIGSPAAAKNVLAVGATANLRTEPEQIVDGHVLTNGDPTVTAEYSSRGPCCDGRIKPDIAAPGTAVLSTRSYLARYPYGTYGDDYAYDTGTSMACPLTAGAVALVREWLMRDCGFTDEEPPTAALMKAIVTGGAKDAATPGNDQGWGRVDLAETLFPSNRAVKLIDRIPFEEETTFSWVVKTTNAAPFDVQLSWIDYPGSPSGDQTEPRLVNDLDLTVRPIDGDEVFFGNGGDSPDTLNNLESVRLEEAAPTQYLVTVSCKGIPHDYTEGGAAALYLRGAFDPDAIEQRWAVRIVKPSAETVGCSRLDQALAAAEDGDVIEILEPTELRGNVMLMNSVSVTVTATNANPRATEVRCRPDADIIVRNGSVFFTNVVFTGATAAPVKVADGGVVRVAGTAVFDDISSGTPGIVTASASGFVLAGRLENGITLACDAASGEGMPFGAYLCSYDDATNSARRLVCASDRRLAGVAKGSGILKWEAGVPVDPSVAVGYIDGDEPVYYRTLDELFEHPDGAKVVITKSGVRLEKPRTLLGNRSIVAAEGVEGLVVRPAASAGFTLGDGCELTVSGIAFEGYRGNGLFVVNGAGAKLTVTNAVFRDIEGTGKQSGTIAVKKGTADISESIFEGCKAGGTSSKGGAIYLAKGCELDLNGGSVSNCSATSYGGGIFAEGGSAVRVRGALTVKGNGSDNNLSDDIYLQNTNTAFVLSGKMEGMRAVGVRYGSSAGTVGNKRKMSFATVGEGVDRTTAASSAKAFFSDADPEGLKAEVDGAAANLVWAEWADGDRLQVDSGDSDATVRVTKGGETRYYVKPEHAFSWVDADAAVEILGDVEFGADLVVPEGVKVTLVSANNAPSVLTRSSYVLIRVLPGASLSVSNLTVDGNAEVLSSGLVKVNGGSLELRSGATIRNVTGLTDRMSGAVAVRNGGTFTLLDGAKITGCANRYYNAGSKAGYGGGLLVEDHSVANLFGGSITGCTANRGGGVFIGTESTVSVKGDVVVSRNWDLAVPAGKSNLWVADLSQLRLTGRFTGAIGYTEGRAGDTNVFGRVEFAGSDDDKQSSAHCFTHDVTGDFGMAVSDGSETLLVWGNALDASGKYGKYALLDGDPVEIGVPAGHRRKYDGTCQTGVEAGAGYRIVSGNAAVDAGAYTATVTTIPGFAWAGGATGDTNVLWTIVGVRYVLTGVTLDDLQVAYDGRPHMMEITGTLPAGLTVCYTNNVRTLPGTNEVTARISGSIPNCEPDPFVTNLCAKLIITDPEGRFDPLNPKPDPRYTVTTNDPSLTPLAFSNIVRIAETEWSISLTNLLKDAEYALSFTDDLATPFTTGAWFKAESSGLWTTNWLFTSGEAKPAYFWRAHGRTTYVTNWLNAVQPQP